MADIGDDLLLPLVAECYRDATLAGADMLRVVQIVEQVRAAAGERQDLALAAEAVHRAIVANTDKQVHAVLAELRSNIHDRIVETTSEQLRAHFERDGQEAWKAWRSVWVHGIWNWPEPVWHRFTAAELPFPGDVLDELAQLRAATRAIRDARWGDVYGVLEGLAAEPWLPMAQRTSLLETLAMIHLYVLVELGPARRLLEQAQELGEVRHRVCAGWAEWWLKQAPAGADPLADHARAHAAARHAIELDPHFGRPWQTLGELASREDHGPGVDEGPEHYFRQAMAEGELDGWQEMLRIELDRANGEQADSGVQAMLALGRRAWPHEEYDAILRFADLLQRRGQYDEADDCYRRAIALAQDRTRAEIDRGYARFEAGDGPAAREMFGLVIGRIPESFEGWYGMAWVCERLSDWAAALPHYERALELRPAWDASLTARIGECLRRLDRPAEAQRTLVAALRRHPDDVDLASGLEDLAQHHYRERDDADAARWIYQQLREIRGESYEGTYRNLRGHVAYWFAEYEAAEAEYRRAADAEPATAVFHSNIGHALAMRVKAGDRDQLPAAILALRTAIGLDPEREDTRALLSSLERHQSVLDRYGAAALERMPLATPVRVELADELLPHILVPDTLDLQPEFQDKIDAMRDRVQEETGVWLSGIRFATFDTWVPGNARCSLFGASLRVAHLPVDACFCPSPIERVRPHAPDAEAAIHPVGGPDGTLVPVASCASVVRAGLPVWETADYLLGWVEGAVRRHLVEFVGHEEIALRLANLTDDDRPDVDLTALTAAVRARLRRGEPVDDLAAVCRQLVATPVPG